MAKSNNKKSKRKTSPRAASSPKGFAKTPVSPMSSDVYAKVVAFCKSAMDKASLASNSIQDVLLGPQPTPVVRKWSQVEDLEKRVAELERAVASFADSRSEPVVVKVVKPALKETTHKPVEDVRRITASDLMDVKLRARGVSFPTERAKVAKITRTTSTPHPAKKTVRKVVSDENDDAPRRRVVGDGSSPALKDISTTLANSPMKRAGSVKTLRTFKKSNDLVQRRVARQTMVDSSSWA